VKGGWRWRTKAFCTRVAPVVRRRRSGLAMPPSCAQETMQGVEQLAAGVERVLVAGRWARNRVEVV
jgi:hypothetical protein